MYKQNTLSASSSSPILFIVSGILIYMQIYTPILNTGLASGTFLIVLSFIYLIMKGGDIGKYLRLYRAELLLSCYLILYVFFVCSQNSVHDTSIVKSLVIWLLFSTIVPFFIVNGILARNKRIVFWNIILEVGFIASLITCIALFVPSFNFFLRNIQLEIKTYGGELEEQLAFRGFGFAYYLTSGYAYCQGLLASLCLLRLDAKHKRYALYFITLTLSVIVNARTGLFPIALTLVYVLMNSVSKIKIITLFKYAFFSIVAYILFMQILSTLPDVKSFVTNFFEQLEGLVLKEDYEDSAYSKMLIFPKTSTGLLFGEGHSLFVSDIQDSSDIGYVNQIFIGGLIFAVGLLLFHLIVYIKIMKRSNDKVFATIFFLSLLVFNYKGAQYCSSIAFTNLWMLYYYVLVHNQIKPQSTIRLG